MISAPGHAATITVTSQSDTDTAGCTLREAIISLNLETLENGCANMADGFGVADSVVFDPVVFHTMGITNIVLDDSKGPLSIVAGKNVAINGLGVDAIAVDGDEETRIFDVSGSILSISDISLTRGSTATRGGAVLVSGGGSLSLTNANVTASQAGVSGGGIAIEGGSAVTLLNVEISQNSAAGQGLVNLDPTGGLLVDDTSSAWLSESTVSSNDSVGISVSENAQLTLIDSEVSQNTGEGIVLRGISELEATPSNPVVFCSATVTNSKINTNVGGGVFSNYCNLDLTNLIVTDNGGSGVFASSATTISLRNSEVSNNGMGGIIGVGRSSASTGGLYPAAPVSLSIVNTTISGNSGGSGLDVTDGSVFLASSTISKNAANQGGGLRIGSLGSVQMANTILSGNVAQNTGAEVYMSGYSGFTSLGSNIIGSASKPYEESVSGPSADQFVLVNEDFNAAVDGEFAAFSSELFGALEDNACQSSVGVSGSSECAKTHGLLKGSLAIDTGNATHCGTGTPVIIDQRGESRLGGACDIGAFEGVITSGHLSEQGLRFVIPVNGKAVNIEL
ncbi:hypothetical protein GCM10008090_06730 [Arenicella chitinivorans]|uniref:Right handed beta helix domain-containing protein n=1 Tax=Arenicella chitinivorans TaxID=1329800 RepID=A0A918RIV4_9GAMM|nr:right-handed parallel beta-helix repeat-containing protein [Arenicella chitinivorans]GHA00539.1 hypothetical protein GCM10008090_06730 [Arenicella chitinivorans]